MEREYLTYAILISLVTARTAIVVLVWWKLKANGFWLLPASCSNSWAETNDCAAIRKIARIRLSAALLQNRVISEL